MGKRSYHANLCLQIEQYDLPPNDFLFKLRSASALTKLPKTVPIKNPANPHIVLIIGTTCHIQLGTNLIAGIISTTIRSHLTTLLL